MQETTISREERLDGLKEYVEHMKRVLDLSSLQLNGIDSADNYRLRLQEAFTEIGALAVRNNEILDRYLYPMLGDDYLPTEEETSVMREFTALLTDTTNMEHQDQALIQLQAESMVRAADTRNDLREKVLARDNLIISSYLMLNMLQRLYPEVDVCFRYRDVGLAAGDRLLAYLEKDKFPLLPDDECRELVLINARYIRCLFEWDDKEDLAACREHDLQMMRRALALAYDPFYTEALPDYRWDAHIFRTLQYVADFPEYHNKLGFTPEQLREIVTCTNRMCDYLREHPVLEAGCPPIEQAFYRECNAFLAGDLSLEEHKNNIEELIGKRDVTDYSARGMMTNYIIPFEYLQTVDREHLSDREKEIITGVYADIAGYAYRMPKTGVLSFMLTYISDYLRNYIEIEGGISFRNMCLKLIAAMHPPTYVHTLNVANLSRAIAEQVIETDASLFTGILGLKNADEVRTEKERLLDFAYNAALIHDIGKLFIVETIITYGRKLLDDEFLLIKAHTIVGASILSKYPSTAPFAEMAMGHHKWYDDSAGYPAQFSMQNAKNKNLIAVLAAADCLDAATDSVGRSYKKGISLTDYIRELKEGSGTRYAPFLSTLFEDVSFRERMERILKEGREENYRKTFRVLKEL